MSSLLIQGGHVLHFDSKSTPSDPRITFKVKDILVEGSKITRIEDSIPAPPGATVINAKDHIVSPGFVDTHRHLWQAALRGIVQPKAIADQTLIEYMCSVRTISQPLVTPDDMYWSQLVGACEAVSSGITTILDQAQGASTPSHVERTIAATRDSGLRSIYAYFKSDPQSWEKWQSRNIREIGDKLRGFSDQRVTLGLGYDGIFWESPNDVKDTLFIASEAGSSLTTVHYVPTHYVRSITDLHKATHALSSDFVFSHFNHASPSEWELVKDLNIGISTTPETEVMSHGLCALFECAEHGVKVGLGIDTHVVCSGDMFGQMRLALQSARSLRNAELYLGPSSTNHKLNEDSPRQLPRELVHTAAHMVRFATLGGAETLNMADKIGSLEVGKLADIVLISLSSPNMLGSTSDSESLSTAMVVLAHPSDVKTVIVNGDIVKQNGKLTKVQWDDVVNGFRAQHSKLDAKIKEASNATDWEEEFNKLREGWGLAPDKFI